MKQLQRIKTLFRWSEQASSLDENKMISQLLQIYIDDLHKDLSVKAKDIQSILTHTEIDAGQLQGKLECLKLYKNRVGCSLMDAKRTIEKFFTDNGLRFYQHY